MKRATEIAVGVALAMAGACRQAPPPRNDTVTFDPALVKEQQRRIASFDSVVRTINTDSSYHLWHAMLTAPDVRAAQLQQMCEDARLSFRYGRAADVALERMNDTLWRGVDPTAVQDLDASLVGESHQIGRSTCAPYPSQRAPYWLEHWTVYELPQLPPSPHSNPPRP